MLHGGEIYDKKIEYDFSVNLNPLPCPDEVKKALETAILDMDKYPDITQKSFRREVAKAESNYLKNAMGIDSLITPEMVIGGNGASELIFAIVGMLKPRTILLPVPSFYGYRHALNALGDGILTNKCKRDQKEVCVQEYLLSKENDFELTHDFVNEINSETDMIILANPNNPTGRAVSEDVLRQIITKCRETGSTLIVDECFLHLSHANVSAIKYLHEFNKLFVVGAYTKLFSIPGVRLGYAFSDEKNIEQLKKYLPEWNLSVFAERAGIACARMMLETDFELQSVELIKKEKERIIEALKAKDIKVFKSDTNYILINSDDYLFEKLLKKGILIRDCSNFQGLTKGYYRIAVKDHESNSYLLNEINTAL